MVDTPLPLSSASHVGVLGAEGDHVTGTAALLRHFAVDALIRLHPEDFDQLAAVGPMLVHFNLEFTSNRVGQRYAILPIVKPGRRLVDGQEVLPVVDPARHRLGTCVETIQHVALSAVTPAQFAESLPGIRTLDGLRAALVRRYQGMLPHLSPEEIVAKGCAVTRLRLAGV